MVWFPTKHKVRVKQFFTFNSYLQSNFATLSPRNDGSILRGGGEIQPYQSATTIKPGEVKNIDYLITSQGVGYIGQQVNRQFLKLMWLKQKKGQI